MSVSILAPLSEAGARVHLLRTAHKENGSAGLAQEDDFRNHESTVDDELDPFNPAPSLGLQNEAWTRR